LNMPRTARVAPGAQVYHVLTRGNNRQNVFEDKKDFRRYLELLLRYKEKYRFNPSSWPNVQNRLYFVFCESMYVVISSSYAQGSLKIHL